MRAGSLWLLGASVALSACASFGGKAPAVAPADLKATTAQAEDSYAKADWANAARQYAVLVQHVPQDANLWFRLGNAYARAEQPDQAITAYREVLVRDGAYAKAWFNMGIVQLREAANSFLKMETNVPEGDPLRVQAEQAYVAIMKIIGDGNAPAAGDATAPPASSANAPTP